MARTGGDDLGFFTCDAEPLSRLNDNELDKTAFVSAYRRHAPRTADEIVRSIDWLKLQAKAKIN